MVVAETNKTLEVTMSEEKADQKYAETDNGVIFNGFLEKESLYLKQFRKRWTVLKRNCLYSYKTQNDMNQATEIIDLTKFDYIISCSNEYQFELRAADDKTKKRVFNAPSHKDRDKWIECIKNVYENKNTSNTINIELPNSKIIWDDTNNIWEYYWLSDGCGKKNIHGPFSCKEMIQRNELYFKKVNEPIMFRRVNVEQNNKWINSDSVDIQYEIKQYNTRSNT